MLFDDEPKNYDYKIWTDGGCFPNPGRGSWAAVIASKTRFIEVFGNQQNTTNQRMEMTAAIQALHVIKRPSIIKVYSDSQYLVKGSSSWMKKWKAFGWKRGKNSDKEIKNIELWKSLDEEIQRHKHVTFEWVRGHAGNEMNERADALCNKMQATPDDVQFRLNVIR